MSAAPDAFLAGRGEAQLDRREPGPVIAQLVLAYENTVRDRNLQAAWYLLRTMGLVQVASTTDNAENNSRIETAMGWVTPASDRAAAPTSDGTGLAQMPPIAPPVVDGWGNGFRD